MKQEIIREYPPNIEDIAIVFPLAMEKNVLFSYGDRIYAPKFKGDIPTALLAHESVHGKRQTIYEPAIKEWWSKYLFDTEFRFAEELLAHQVEYSMYHGKSRNYRRVVLNDIAAKLSAPLYGRMVSFEQAKRLIKEGVK